MKRVLFYSILAVVFMLNTASMCSSDDNSSSSSPDPTAVVNTVTQGTWRVTLFSEDGVDHTNNFTGYDFTFGTSNVLTATNGTNTYTGVWSVTSDDSSDDDNPSGDIDFNILFSSPNSFAELSEDWHILERTSTKIRLQHISGGDGSTDLLTFEKN
jgi:hypothetical protein